MDLGLKTIQGLFYNQIRDLTLRATRLDVLGEGVVNQLLKKKWLE